MTPPPPISRDQVEVLTSLLDSKGLDAGDLLDAIQLLASAKKASGKVPDESADESGFGLVSVSNIACMPSRNATTPVEMCANLFS